MHHFLHESSQVMVTKALKSLKLNYFKILDFPSLAHDTLSLYKVCSKLYCPLKEHIFKLSEILKCKTIKLEFCQGCLQYARQLLQFQFVYVRACVHPSGFVQAITSTFMH